MSGILGMEPVRPSLCYLLKPLYRRSLKGAGDIAVNLLKRRGLTSHTREMNLGLMATAESNGLLQRSNPGKPCYVGVSRRETPCTLCISEIVTAQQPCIMGKVALGGPNRERGSLRSGPHPDVD